MKIIFTDCFQFVFAEALKHIRAKVIIAVKLWWLVSAFFFNQKVNFYSSQRTTIGKQSLWLVHFLSHLPAPDTLSCPDSSVVIQKTRLNSLSQIWYAISVKDLVPLTFQLEGWNINIQPLLCKVGQPSASHFLLLLLTHPFHIRKTSIIFIDIARSKNNTISGILQPNHGSPCLAGWPRLPETFSWGLTQNWQETPAFRR